MPGKTIIIYYSRTGTSEKLAQKMALERGCAARRIELADGKKISAIGAGAQSMRKATPEIRGDVGDIGDYDRIVYITPVWASHVASPIRSHMAKYKGVTKEYELHAVFMGRDFEGVVRDAEAIIGKPAAVAEPHLKTDIMG